MSDLLSIDEELVQLRAENSRLRREQEHQGPVRVMPPEITAVWPMRIEMQELLGAVIDHWPHDFAAVEPNAFARAFRILGSFHRQAELDHEHSVGHWVAVANARLSKRGEQGIRYMDLLAAVLAWGDIPLTDWQLKDEGVALEFSLNEFIGRLPKDEWRRTLRGKFVTPIDPRSKRYMNANAPRPIVLVDGKPLPDQMRFVGPRYWHESM
jgi:hypothetical protein